VEDKMIFKENTIIWTETGSVVSLLLMNYTWEVKTISHRMYNNKGRNVYFFLPFILGLIGLMYHANKDLKARFTCFVPFTGIALKNYLNERPFEPRKRLCIGRIFYVLLSIGFGVYAL
jgi:hypothetical protein